MAESLTTYLEFFGHLISVKWRRKAYTTATHDSYSMFSFAALISIFEDLFCVLCICIAVFM